MRIMSYEEYAKVEHGSPYILKLKRKNGSLYYFGEKHSFDPNFEQWKDAKGLWAEFLADPSLKKIALVEGGVRTARATEADSVIADGGMGLVAYLAAQAGIETASPEPEDRVERTGLEKEFSRDEIQYYYFARMVHQWLRKAEPRPDFDVYLTRSLEADRRTSGWADYDFSLSHMYAVHKRLFGAPFSLNDKGLFYETTNPVNEKRNRINDVSKRSGELRDEHVVNVIADYLEKGYSVYAQYGHSHVVMQEPWLRERFEVDLA